MSTQPICGPRVSSTHDSREVRNPRRTARSSRRLCDQAEEALTGLVQDEPKIGLVWRSRTDRAEFSAPTIKTLRSVAPGGIDEIGRGSAKEARRSSLRRQRRGV